MSNTPVYLGRMTIDEFLSFIKVVRMLYGVEFARYFFEKNFEEFTDAKLDDFIKSVERIQKISKYDNMTTTQEKTGENK